jgi:hypothetical protein
VKLDFITGLLHLLVAHAQIPLETNKIIFLLAQTPQNTILTDLMIIKPISPLEIYNVDVFGVAETNIDWKGPTRTIARNQCQSFYKNALIATSSSTDHGTSDFQPGGTLTTVTGRWTGRNTKSITDPFGMGRWSDFSLQKSDSSLVHIITAYRPVTTSFDSDAHTFSHQNWNILRTRGVPNPNPPHQFFIDLNTTLEKSTVTK